MVDKCYGFDTNTEFRHDHILMISWLMLCLVHRVRFVAKSIPSMQFPRSIDKINQRILQDLSQCSYVFVQWASLDFQSQSFYVISYYVILVRRIISTCKICWYLPFNLRNHHTQRSIVRHDILNLCHVKPLHIFQTFKGNFKVRFDQYIWII